jgi:hypothetical protein
LRRSLRSGIYWSELESDVLIANPDTQLLRFPSMNRRPEAAPREREKETINDPKPAPLRWGVEQWFIKDRWPSGRFLFLPSGLIVSQEFRN